jgi:hypothetical protein
LVIYQYNESVTNNIPKDKPMIPNKPKNKKTLSTRAYLPSTVKPDTLEALNKKAKETGNRSFIVDQAIRLYLGLKDEPETGKIAS